MTPPQLCCLVGRVLAPGKLLPSPKEAVADPLKSTKTSDVWMVVFSCATCVHDPEDELQLKNK